MKLLFMFSMVATLGFSALASASNISRTCTNASGTILVKDYDQVKVITDMYNAIGRKRQKSQTFDLQSDVKMDVIESTDIESEQGCSFTSSTTVKKVKINKLDGTSMPAAYSQNVEADGSLIDILLCEETRSWMMPPWAKCP